MFNTKDKLASVTAQEAGREKPMQRCKTPKEVMERLPMVFEDNKESARLRFLCRFGASGDFQAYGKFAAQRRGELVQLMGELAVASDLLAQKDLGGFVAHYTDDHLRLPKEKDAVRLFAHKLADCILNWYCYPTTASFKAATEQSDMFSLESLRTYAGKIRVKEVRVGLVPLEPQTILIEGPHVMEVLFERESLVDRLVEETKSMAAMFDGSFRRFKLSADAMRYFTVERYDTYDYEGDISEERDSHTDVCFASFVETIWDEERCQDSWPQ